MGKHLVLVGGGHAHMVTMANLNSFVENGHHVTVIGPSAWHYYSGMGPGMLGRTYTPDDIRFATKHVVEKQGGTFVTDRVARIDPETKTVYLESGPSLTYDVLSFNAGSFVPGDIVKEDNGDIFSVKPIEKLIEARDRIQSLVLQKKISVSVIGGGPASLEIAGNVWQLAKRYGKHMPHIQVVAGKAFLNRFPEKIQQMARKSLVSRGIDILEKGYVKEIRTGQISMASGETYHPDFVILATGVKPSLVFKASGLPIGPDGGLRVNFYLQSTQYPDIFGGGDCIYFQDQPLDKVGVYAVRQNPVLFHNLTASLQGERLIPFDPGGDYLLIFNMGGGKGILRKRNVQFCGRPAFIIKDYIDRKFMKKFQTSE